MKKDASSSNQRLYFKVAFLLSQEKNVDAPQKEAFLSRLFRVARHDVV